VGLIIPKENKLPTQAVYDNAHELKVIIFKNMILFCGRTSKKVMTMRFIYRRNGVQEE
jgi:hypothetical protein